MVRNFEKQRSSYSPVLDKNQPKLLIYLYDKNLRYLVSLIQNKMTFPTPRLGTLLFSIMINDIKIVQGPVVRTSFS